jgi:apolipoprotein N-acyltransferase
MPATNPPFPDPYDPPPSFWRQHEAKLWALAVFGLTVVLTVMSFPPYRAWEFAYVFAAPAILWAYFRPPLKLYIWTMFAAQAVAWAIILGWLRHVTWAGPLLLAPFVGAWVGVWYLAAWWTMPRMIGQPTPVRVAAMLGLAGLWVLIEWSRTWLFGGFAWLPLAASQWQSAGIIQIAAFTGAWGVSFVLVAVNVGFAAYLHRLLGEGPALERRRHRRLLGADAGPEIDEIRDWGFRRRSQEFLLALFLLLVCLCVFLVEVQPMVRFRLYNQPLARVAFVQPDIPQSLKWDPNEAPGIVKILEEQTLAAAISRPDLILWPEASAPVPVNRDPGMRRIVENLAARTKIPLLIGSVAVEGEGDSEKWYNAAMLVEPEGGLQPNYYAKRNLVPFGEYVPLRPLLGWLSKIAPIPDGDFTPGTEPDPMVLGLRDGGAIALGPLVCYEDTYPQLARSSALAGSDALVVLTNDAWFGEGAAAYQHAAHSVLRAVETRRPVLRCGNGGWSGWIDEFGGIRGVLTGSDGSVYFRGTGVLGVMRDTRWIGRNSFYVEHGDWFVAVCAGLVLFGFALIRVGRSRV